MVVTIPEFLFSVKYEQYHYLDARLRFNTVWGKGAMLFASRHVRRMVKRNQKWSKEYVPRILPAGFTYSESKPYNGHTERVMGSVRKALGGRSVYTARSGVKVHNWEVLRKIRLIRAYRDFLGQHFRPVLDSMGGSVAAVRELRRRFVSHEEVDYFRITYSNAGFVLGGAPPLEPYVDIFYPPSL